MNFPDAIRKCLISNFFSRNYSRTVIDFFSAFMPLLLGNCFWRERSRKPKIGGTHGGERGLSLKRVSVGNLLFGFDCDVRLRNPDVAADGHHVGEVEVLGLLIAADQHLEVGFFLGPLAEPLEELLTSDLFSLEDIGSVLADVDLDQVACGLGEGLVA